MITNLFSIFDPSTKLIIDLSINWISIFFLLFIIPNLYWLIPNNLNLIYIKLLSSLFNEFKLILKKKNNNFNIIFISLFILIITYNFIGLFPFIFTRTRHLSINLTLAISLWLGIIFFGWIKQTTHMFIHLVPQGTPKILIPFIVLIESISIIIRPITLTIRLTANIIAGHLLLTLLGNLGSKLSITLIPFLLIIQIILLTLESAVTIIQSYVFAILITLYIREV